MGANFTLFAAYHRQQKLNGNDSVHDSDTPMDATNAAVKTYPYQIEYWSRLRDLEADDNHKRTKRATVLASSEDDAKKRFEDTGIKYAHLIVHEGIMR